MTNKTIDVLDFTQKFGLPISDVIAYPTSDRMNLIAEEFDEILIANARGDLAGVLDGLVDLVYVCIGTAIQANLPFDKAWALVHAANMLKERADPKPNDLTHQGVIKPEGWVSPDIERLIRDAIDKR